MTDREREITRFALRFLKSNLDDAWIGDDSGSGETPATEDEIDNILDPAGFHASPRIRPLLEAAGRAYVAENGEAEVFAQYCVDPDGEYSDTLAKFVVRELCDTFDDERIGQSAADALRSAARHLDGIASALEDFPA